MRKICLLFTAALMLGLSVAMNAQGLKVSGVVRMQALEKESHSRLS